MKGAIFSSKISMITNVILFIELLYKINKLILRDLRFRHHIACFLCISPTKNNSKQLQRCLSLSDLFVNDSFV